MLNKNRNRRRRQAAVFPSSGSATATMVSEAPVHFRLNTVPAQHLDPSAIGQLPPARIDWSPTSQYWTSSPLSAAPTETAWVSSPTDAGQCRQPHRPGATNDCIVDLVGQPLYVSRWMVVLGWAMIFVGIAAIGCNGAVFYAQTELSHAELGQGFWSGLMSVIAGVAGMVAGTSRSRCVVAVSTVLLFVSSLVAMAAVALSVVYAMHSLYNTDSSNSDRHRLFEESTFYHKKNMVFILETIIAGLETVGVALSVTCTIASFSRSLCLFRQAALSSSMVTKIWGPIKSSLLRMLYAGDHLTTEMEKEQFMINSRYLSVLKLLQTQRSCSGSHELQQEPVTYQNPRSRQQPAVWVRTQVMPTAPPRTPSNMSTNVYWSQLQASDGSVEASSVVLPPAYDDVVRAKP